MSQLGKSRTGQGRTGMQKKLLLGAAVAALLLATAGGAFAAPKQGGTMTETFKNDVSTLDQRSAMTGRTGR